MRLLMLAPLAAALHITPAVVLVKRPDAVQALLPGADAYFAREVHLSQTDAHRLHQEVDWSPEDGVLTLYTGKKLAPLGIALVTVAAAGCFPATEPITRGIAIGTTGGTASALLVFRVQPSNVTAGNVMTPAVQVEAHDTLGNVDTGFTASVTVTIGTNQVGGNLSGKTSVAPVNGLPLF